MDVYGGWSTSLEIQVRFARDLHRDARSAYIDRVSRTLSRCHLGYSNRSDASESPGCRKHSLRLYGPKTWHLQARVRGENILTRLPDCLF